MVSVYLKVIHSLYDMIKRQFSQSTQEYKRLYGANLEESPNTHGNCSNFVPKKALSVALFSVIVIANILLFLASTAMWFSERNCDADECEKQISAYSPIFDRMEIRRTLSRYNNSFWTDDPPSIYQLRPSPEVDRAWDRLSAGPGIPFTAEEVIRSGWDPRTLWPVPPEELEGDEVRYWGLIDVFHQVHCLNELRKTAFPAYYGDRREKHKFVPLPYEDHLLHCQYSILKALTCHADLEISVFQKFKGWPGVNINFQKDRKCRNFEDILEWKEAHEIVPKRAGTEYPDTPIIEQDPEGVLAPIGHHYSRQETLEIFGKKDLLNLPGA